MRTCLDCKQNLPKEAFGACRADASGLKMYCRVCNNARSKTYKEANRDKVSSQSRTYREKNKVAVAAYRRTWLASNKETIKKYRQQHAAYTREWYKKNAKKINSAQKRQIAILSDDYVRELLIAKTNLRPGDIPDWLLRLKRAQLQLKRELKQETL